MSNLYTNTLEISGKFTNEPSSRVNDKEITFLSNRFLAGDICPQHLPEGGTKVAVCDAM
jgi:hypothetical protein